MDNRNDIISNSAESINAVVEKYSSLVYRIARSYFRNSHDADDIYQEVFLRYISKERVFKSEEHRKAWLIRVTINCCNSFYSSSWNKKTTLLDDERAEDEPVFMDSSQNEIYEAVVNLPDKLKDAVVFFYFEGMSVTETAKTLKTTEASVKMRLMRARKILKLDLEGSEVL